MVRPVSASYEACSSEGCSACGADVTTRTRGGDDGPADGAGASSPTWPLGGASRVKRTLRQGHARPRSIVSRAVRYADVDVAPADSSAAGRHTRRPGSDVRTTATAAAQVASRKLIRSTVPRLVLGLRRSRAAEQRKVQRDLANLTSCAGAVLAPGTIIAQHGSLAPPTALSPARLSVLVGSGHRLRPIRVSDEIGIARLNDRCAHGPAGYVCLRTKRLRPCLRSACSASPCSSGVADVRLG